MLTSDKCRARAAEWAVRAEHAAEGPFKATLERVARNWATLAATMLRDETEAAKRRRDGR